MGISLLGNSKPGVYKREWQAALDRHGFQRVRILRSAVTTHSVRFALQCEHATEVHVVTSKEKIEDSHDGRHRAFRRRLLLCSPEPRQTIRFALRA